ncbi:MAG: PglZ domain-containing protein [Anaerolineales bacterium]|nr:MAG: PglZ domain-containing protein [Anaerolineales bacterium]
MGTVTDRLLQLIETYIDRHGVVVWYDPQGHYSDVVTASSWPNTAVHRYQGSFFLLRHKIEPYLARDQVPRLIVYMDAARSTSARALAEVEAAGVVLEPGASDERDTALATIGCSALAGTLSPQALEEVLRNESLTLADLDRIAQGGGAVTGVLSLVFGASASPSDVALIFMADPDVDDAIIAKSAQGDLAALLREAFGLPEPASQSLSDLRTRFTRHVLLTDFRASLPDEMASEVLVTVPFPGAQWQVEACQRLAARWRDSVQHRAAYKTAAHQVEQDYSIHGLDLSWEAQGQAQTFPSIEALLLDRAERQILDGTYAEALALVEQRKNSFWNMDENALRWSLIRVLVSLLTGCTEVEEALKTQPRSAGEMITAYAQGAERDVEPWCVLDTLHRHMERLYAGPGSAPTLDQAVWKAREAYTTVMHRMAELFGDALAQTQFQVPEVAQQINIFREQVAPRVQKEKVAYLWMDALRFEMARELLAGFSEASRTTLIPALAAVPTLTLVGMAALLPGAERGLGLVEVGGQLASEVNGQPLRVRRERVEYLAQRGGYAVEFFTLADVLKPGRTVKERIGRAQLVVVTSQEIDQIAEQQPTYLARSVMDDLLIYIKRVLHNLAELGVGAFVIASDHGFLFGDELASDMLIDPPGEQTVKLTQRVWIGRGGATPPGCLRVKASDVGVGGDLQFVFPPGLASFKVRGGADPYCHGGLSLQELIVPVAIVQMTPTEVPLVQGAFSLIMERLRVTSRVFTIAVSYTVTGLFDVTSRRVRCTAQHRGEAVARAVAAAYGYDDRTGEVALEKDRVNYITLVMTKEMTQGPLTISLVDPETEAELARLENVEVEIAI